MRVRWVRCRPMGSVTVPPAVITPVHSARYSRPILREVIAAVRAACASGVRATTRRPLVSLSSRCTRPARGSRASCGSSASSAFCRVCRALPAPGCTTSPGGLLMMKTDGSWKRTASGIASAAGAVWAASCASMRDRKSTRLNSSHSQISYAVFCLKKKRPCQDSMGTLETLEHLRQLIATVIVETLASTVDQQVEVHALVTVDLGDVLVVVDFSPRL